MARKRSRKLKLAAQTCGIAAVLVVSEAGRAEEAGTARPSPSSVRNPFASGDSSTDESAAEAASAAETRDAGTPRGPRRTIDFQNPFASGSVRPPGGASGVPGPVSRWKKSFGSAGAAIVSEHLRDEQRARAPVSKPTEVPSVAAQFAETSGPVPIAGPVGGQAWLPAEAPAIRRQASVQQASLAVSGDLSGVAAQDEWAEADFAPHVISNYSDTPEGWLAQAQHAARRAESLDELATVSALCQRGLACGHSSEYSPQLRRLAAWAHNRRGELLAGAGKPQLAISDFQMAISLDPQCGLAIHNRAVSLAEEKHFEAALRDFHRVIELNPGLAVAYRNRAELLAAVGRVEEAIADFDRAVELLPDDAGLYLARGDVLRRVGEIERAREDFDRAIGIAPHDAEGIAQRGNLSAACGDYGSALADLRQAVAIDANCLTAHRSLAWLQATSADKRYRDAAAALSAAETAMELSSGDDYLTLEALAAAHAVVGQFDQAARIQQQAIAAAPVDTAEPLRDRLGLYRAGRAYVSTASPTGNQSQGPSADGRSPSRH